MDVANLRIRYRPLKIGFCVSENDIEGFRIAVKLSTTMWGGRFNPIIPITGNAVLADALTSAFRLDALYAVSDTPAVTTFIESMKHLKWPGYEKHLFVQRQGGVDATTLDIYHPVRHLAQRPPTATDKSLQPLFPTWTDNDPLKDVLLATCGAFPSEETIGKDYSSLFRRLKPTESSIQNTDAIPSDTLEMLTPLALTALELSPTRFSWGHEEPGFYIGSANDFTDLINFWNLQAANIDLVFYDPAFQDRLRPTTTTHKAWLLDRPKRDPEWPFHSSLWMKDREPLPDMTPFGEGFAISVIDEHLWDRNTIWKPPSMTFEEQSILGTVSREFERPTVTFQMPAKPFFSHFSFREQKLVASIRPLIQNSDFILCPPYTPELNEYYGREIHFDSTKVRSEPDSIGIIIDATKPDLTLRALDGNRLVERIFASRGMKATPSDAGRIGHRLVQQMGGLQGCRVFKIPGVRELIRAHGPLQSFTRSGANQTIRGFDPATNSESFAAHKQLHIRYRESGDFKPEDAFAYLLDKKMFRAGLSFVCPNCALEFWLHLDSLETVSTCEYCDTSFNVMTQLRDRDWRFRRSGLFGRDDNQAGGIPVSVVLQQLETTLHNKILAWTTGMNVELSDPPHWKCETDFVLIVENGREGPQIVISEVKSPGGEIMDADAANLARLADLFEGSSLQPYIVFAKLGSFSAAEIERCKTAQHRRRNRIILLSDRELEPYFVYERTAEQFEIQSSAINLEDLATATNSVFFNPRPKVGPPPPQ